MILLPIAWFAFGVFVLVVGAESLVKGSSRLAVTFGIPPVVVGLTVVAIATSSPEFVVTMMAGLRGNTDMALGNVVGSNIANVGLILALSALISPLAAKLKSLWRELAGMFAASLLVLFMAWDRRIERVEGVILLLGLVVFMTLVIIHTYRHRNWDNNGGAYSASSIVPRLQRIDLFARIKHTAQLWDGILVMFGMAALILGSRLMIDSALDIAGILDISSLVVGLTIVAIGTSLPELAASAVAAYREQPEIVLGNVIGSNLFNLFGVLGPLAILHSISVQPDTLFFQIPLMLIFSALMVLMIRTGKGVARTEGMVLLAGYGAFIFFIYIY